MISPHAMNGRAASGLSRTLANPPSSTIASLSPAPRMTAARRLTWSASISVAPMTAPRPVTANWLAYVPEKPAWVFQYESWPGRTWMSSGLTPRMSAATWAATVSWPCPCGTVPSVSTISPNRSSLMVATSLLPENWSSGLSSWDWPKLFVPQLVGDDVDDPLGQPQVLHAGVAAIGPDRRLVGHHLREVDPDVPPAIHPRRDLSPDDAAERLVAGEGAAVVERAGLEPEHGPVR